VDGLFDAMTQPHDHVRGDHQARFQRFLMRIAMGGGVFQTLRDRAGFRYQWIDLHVGPFQF